MIGKTISHYRILEELGHGGMGVVYKAEDLKLDRLVALKFLPRELAPFQGGGDRLRRERFAQEAKASSAIDHPNIATIHEVGDTDDGETFIVMAYYEGETLRQRLERGPLAIEDALAIAEQIAGGLAKAHERGIVHRDIKPGNIIVTREGLIKIIDFGLAKLAEVTRMTRPGTLMGTAAYMSPEQARGDDVDERTDLWSLGVVLYEMLTGQVPFRGVRESAVVHSILHDTPRPPRELRRDLPQEVEEILLRALAKDRDRRLGSASELASELATLRAARIPSRSFLTRRRGWLAAVIGIAIFGGAVLAALHRNRSQRWAREEALPQVLRLEQEENYWDAFSLAEQAEEYIPSDPQLVKAWPRISVRLSVETSVPGAEVSIRRYQVPTDEWKHLGRSPIVGLRIPRGYFLWKIEKEGFRTLEAARGSNGRFGIQGDDEVTFQWRLEDEASAPAGMVRVPGGRSPLRISGLDHLPQVELGDFWIDRYEVTNEQFQEFVDSGGYQKRDYWKQPLIKDGRELDWNDAIKEFVDLTGRPGPSTWELGKFPKGTGNHPVSGVSWYEAAAYAEFRGKQLPTVYHWSQAAGTPAGAYLVPLSNIAGRSPGILPVGTEPGISPYGAYDMAGNVKEWCWNEGRDHKRYILGGAWNEPSYMFLDQDAQSPWERSSDYGFRCAKTVSESALPMAATGLLLDAFRDYAKEKPVPDEVFRIYKSLYTYDKTPLNSLVESVDDTPEGWNREKITFDAAYGSERVTSYLFIPKKAEPPFQTVVYFPGSNAIGARSMEDSSSWPFDFLIESGRALMFPIYKGTFERSDDLESDVPAETSLYRDHVLFWTKDLGRSIDYLETRDDIDASKLGYYGISWGGALIQLPAVEPRFKLAVLVGGGYYFTRALPEVDQINFVPRQTAPTLLINGESDFYCPVETCVQPFYRLLGTPEKDRRLVITESGHMPPRNQMIKETLDWLDHYLGRVQMAQESSH